MTRGALLLLAVVVGALVPRAALAHDGLVRSSPARDAHLGVPPLSLRLTFNRAPNLSLARVVLTGPGDARVALRPLRLDSVATVVADLATPIGPGVYRVAWQITGTDGHPVRGEFRFTVAAPASPGDVHAGPGADSAAPAAASHHDPATMPGGAFGVQSPAYVAVRWLALGALVALLGAIAFYFAVLRRVESPVAEDQPGWVERADARLGVAAGFMAVAFAITTAMRLVAQSLALHGGEAFDAALVRGMLLETSWGRAWIVQMLAAIGLLFLFRASGRARWFAAAAACVVIAVAQAASGHAMSAGIAAIASDSVHIVSAAGWIGGLAALLFVGVPAAMTLAPPRRFAAVAELVNRFSPMALAFAGALTVSGAFSAWIHLRSPAALWTSEYGQTLLWKLGVLTLVVATGAYNWKRVRPVVHESAGPARLRRSAGIELAVAAVVIAITAVLVATPPPVVAAATNPPTP